MPSGTVLASSLSLDEMIFFFMQIDHSVVVIYVNPEERLHNFPLSKVSACRSALTLPKDIINESFA